MTVYYCQQHGYYQPQQITGMIQCCPICANASLQNQFQGGGLSQMQFETRMEMHLSNKLMDIERKLDRVLALLTKDQGG